MTWREYQKRFRAVEAQREKVLELRLRTEALEQSLFNSPKHYFAEFRNGQERRSGVPNKVNVDIWRYKYERERVELEVMQGVLDNTPVPRPPWYVRLWWRVAGTGLPKAKVNK